MSNDINVKFSSRWLENSVWSGAIEFTMKNNSGETLTNPEIKFQLGQNCATLENTGFSFTQRNNLITGYLKPHQNTVPDGATVRFSVGASFPQGNNQHALPVAFWVNGRNATGGNAKPDVTAPTKPTGLKALKATAGSILVSWNSSTDDTRVDHYVVSYLTTGSGPKTTTASEVSTTLTGLVAATKYKISVTAVDPSGNVSQPSDMIEATTESAAADTTPPTVPAGLKIGKITSSTVTLAWNASTDNSDVSGYRVKYSAKGGTSNVINATTTACNVTGLNAGTVYSFCVAACDVQNNLSPYSSSVEGTTLENQATKTVFAPYLDVTLNANWNTSPPLVNTRYVTEALALNVKKFHLAFLVQNYGSKNLVWGNSAFPYEFIKPLSDMINQAGGEVIVAFGGANGTDPSVSFSKEELTNVYLGLKKDFNVRHIDFDFETAGQYNYQIAFPAALAAQKQDPELWFSLTLPVLPTGLVTEGLEMIRFAKKIGLKLYVQIMAMDYGSSGIDMGDAAVSAIEGTLANLVSIYPDTPAEDLCKRLGVIAMIGQNDTVGEMFSFQDTVQMTQYATQKGIYLVSMWSLTRDFPGMGDLAVCSRNPEQTRDYEYTTTFIKSLQ